LFANNPSGFISHRNTFIAVMEAAEFCDCYDPAIVHNPTLNRALLFERKTRTRSPTALKLGQADPEQPIPLGIKRSRSRT